MVAFWRALCLNLFRFWDHLLLAKRELLKISFVFGFIYFVQGMSGLPGLPIQYLIKNVMKLNEVDAQYFAAATSLAWLVKPIWGYISDTFPIMGYRRKPYLIGMSFAAASAWFGLAWMAYNQNFNYWGLFIMFNLSAAAYAFVDVVCDGLMVASGKASKLMDFFVNIQWLGMGIAGIMVGIFSGYFAETANQNISFYPYIFSIAGLIPIFTAALVVFFVKEERVTSQFPWLKFFTSLAVLAVIGVAGMKVIPYFQSRAVEIKISFAMGLFFLGSIAVWFWAGRPKLFWAMTLFLFFWSFSPSVGTAKFYYLSDVLKFSEKFFGYLNSLGSICWLIGIFLYGTVQRFFPGIKRKEYLYFSVILAAFGLAVDYLYYLNPQTGIFGFKLNFYAIAVVAAIFFSLFGVAGFLVPLAIAGDASRSGKEAITYAWFMSVYNFGVTMSSFVGGWLYQNLQGTDFTSLSVILGTGDFMGSEAVKVLILRLFVWISALFTLFTIPLVYYTKIPERVSKGDL